MIYILTIGEYSDYSIQQVLDVPGRLTADDAKRFADWFKDNGAAGTFDSDYERNRMLSLRAWLIAVKGARQIEYGELHVDDGAGPIL